MCPARHLVASVRAANLVGIGAFGVQRQGVVSYLCCGPGGRRPHNMNVAAPSGRSSDEAATSHAAGPEIGTPHDDGSHGGPGAGLHTAWSQAASPAACEAPLVNEAARAMLQHSKGVTRVPLEDLGPALFNRQGAATCGQHCHDLGTRILTMEGFATFRYVVGFVMNPTRRTCSLWPGMATAWRWRIPCCPACP